MVMTSRNWLERPTSAATKATPGATGRVRGGPLYWTPTVEGLWNYDLPIANPEHLDNDCWHLGLQPDTIADIKNSIEHPKELLYFDLTPKRIRDLPQLKAILDRARKLERGRP